MQREQLWKYEAMAVFNQYGGGLAERNVYRHINGVHLGPRRAPTGTFNESAYPDMIKALEAVDFFTQLPSL
jgi:hypothetical protein